MQPEHDPGYDTDEDAHIDALVRRNFAFIDLCGFTSLTDEHGVGAAVAALSTFRAVVRERAGWRGVRVAKWLGDGAMLVATEPRPLLDAVLRMEQALDLRGCALPLRGGVAAGRVILFEGDDYIGRPVNLAARLVGRLGGIIAAGHAPEGGAMFTIALPAPTGPYPTRT